MKVVLAEKPSVAQSIARIVGATHKKDGFYEGNGWQVTYAFGHLIQLALPENYGYNSWSKGNLPMLPKEFLMIPRQKKEGKTYKNDPGVMKQLRIIKRLFEDADTIIGATDSAREGEAILRYIVDYLGIKKPIMRLWINSLTDAAIKEGLNNLQPDSNYDNLFIAAKARSEADWLVGMNATQACSIMGKSLYSIGRVQTPTFVMIVERYQQNKEFKSVPFWQVALNTTDGVKLTSAGRWDEKCKAESAYNTVSKARSGKVIKAEKKMKTEQPPLLFSLTDLQKAANSKHGYSADKTLNIAQSLYEKQLISYPRTGSSYIPDDVYETIPGLLKNPVFDKFRECVNAIEKPSKRSVDASKIEDHHALIVTGIDFKIKDIRPDEQVIYDMILGRMVETFSKPSEKEVDTYTVDAGGYLFTVTNTIILQKAGELFMALMTRNVRLFLLGIKARQFALLVLNYCRDRPSPSRCIPKVHCLLLWKHVVRTSRTKHSVKPSRIVVSVRQLPERVSSKPLLPETMLLGKRSRWFLRPKVWKSTRSSRTWI